MQPTKPFYERTPVQILGTLLVLMAIFALGAYAQLTFKKAGESMYGPATISVTGTGEVLAVPDLGNFTFAVEARGETAEEAQEQSAEAMNEILAYLTEQGVADEDVKTTNYNLNPRYTYEDRICPANSYCPPGEPILDGYEVYQSVSVKVRNTDQSGTLISGVGERGATNLSGLYFTVDDDEELKEEARAKAIADAKVKAAKLARDLGVKLVRIQGYYENEGMYPSPYGYGGEMAMMESADAKARTVPNIPTGENKTMSQVTIIFEIK